MTDKEKAVVMAYTGYSMLAGDKFPIFHKYVEDLMGRPVYTHELASKSLWDELHERSHDDFLTLCMVDGEYEWEYPYNDIVIGGKRIGKRDKRCPKCKSNFSNNLPWNARYCPNCGAKMKGDVKNDQDLY